jgi:hypothetical protein
MKAPCVVGAYKAFACVAALIAAQLNTAMGAAVVKNFHAFVDVPDHHHRLPANVHGEIVANLFHLRIMATIDPSLLKDMFHFKIKQLLIGVDALVNAIGLNQMV